MKYLLQTALYAALLLPQPALAQNGDNSKEVKAEASAAYRIPRPAVFRADDVAKLVSYKDARKEYLSERLLPEQKNHVDPNDAKAYRILRQEVDGRPLEIFGIIPVSTSRRYSHAFGNAVLRLIGQKTKSALSRASSGEN